MAMPKTPLTPTAGVGANVKAEMARASITQTTLALALGLTQPQVSARLSGRVPWRIDEVVTVASLLDVPLATLLAGIEAAA